MYDSFLLGKLFQFNNEFIENWPSYGFVDLYQIGEVSYEEGFELPVHNQWCIEISIIMSGQGIFNADGCEYDVSDGDIFINPSNGKHGIRAVKGNLRYYYLGFMFNDKTNDSFKDIIDFFGDIKRHKAHDHYRISSVLVKLIDEFGNANPYSDQLIKNYIEEILILTFRAFTSFSKTTYNITDQRHKIIGGNVYSVIKYIDNNILTLTDIKSISRDLNFSYSYLSHMFKNKMGMTLQQYISHKKIERSCELIDENKSSLTEIALSLNYESLQSFSKAFKRVLGISPTEYKKGGV